MNCIITDFTFIKLQAVRDHKDPPDHEGSLVFPDLTANLDNQVLGDSVVRMVPQDQLDLRDLKAHEVRLAHLVLTDHPDSVENLDQLDHREHLDHKDLKAHKAREDLLENVVKLAPEEKLDHLGQQENREEMVNTTRYALLSDPRE